MNTLKDKIIENTNEVDTTISKEIKEIQKMEKTIKPKNKLYTILLIILITIITIFILAFLFFAFYTTFSPNIISGVNIKGVEVSGLSKSDARYQLDQYFTQTLPPEIKLKHNDFETTISLSQIEANFDTKSATESAFEIGRNGNIFKNAFSTFSTRFNQINVEPNLILNEEELANQLNEISTQLPDKVEQSSYYIENNNLFITSGKQGNIVDVPATIDALKNSITTLDCVNNPVEIAVTAESPEKIDIEKIHSEIYKEPVNAYYEKEPFAVFPHENGLDFKISMDEAKAIIDSEEKEEYTIPLKTLYPQVTTNMIGSEAFPDLLSTYSTRYNASNRNRTTNLILASNKINGTVLMPGETFSYNKVVGKRTIAAGYKEASIYVDGKEVDGLGGGICQITSTLYNAVVYANLEVTQRSNHQFIPPYTPVSRDATVVYGSQDFKFKNNRKYPIKITCSVSGGVANFKIFGIKQDDDYDVEISSYITGKTATSIYGEAYKILKKDGKVVKKELMSKDTYKKH